ncbi:MAG: NAD(P)H-dependent glycerol-3-phosphate dehydrogenase [Candidatus Marinamargulisbacteria bacterium]
MTSVAVIGAGAWGTTIASILAEQIDGVKLWCYRESLAQEILTQGTHHRLPGVQLPSNIIATTHFEDCYDSDITVLGLSSAQLVQYDHTLDWSRMRRVVVLAKGLIDSDLFISDWLARRFEGDIAVLSGPNLALEIAQKKPAATVVASKNDAFSRELQALLSRSYFRVYTASDVRGVECGGIFKNVFAIAAGCIDALGYGQNATSALITRGLVELGRLFCHFKAEETTLMGLSGVGDLIATCGSSQSRNWQLGHAIISTPNRSDWFQSNRGETEGIRTLQLLIDKGLSKSLNLPIIDAIGRLLFDETVSPNLMIQTLMERGLKSEFDPLI